VGTHSFLAFDPFCALVERDGRALWIEADRQRTVAAGGLRSLAAALNEYRLDPIPGGPPFPSGAAGYLGYELARSLEQIPAARVRETSVPELEVAFYDLVIGWNHASGEAWIASSGRPESGAKRLAHARGRIEQVHCWLAGGPPPTARLAGSAPAGEPTKRTGPAGVDERPSADPGGVVPAHAVPAREGAISTFTPAGYREAVRRCIEYIRSGDIFQVNLSQRLMAAPARPPFDLYRSLRTVNPSPFGAYFNTPSCVLAGASPERFLRVTAGGEVETRPIKGTRPRGRTPAEDAQLRRELAASGKDRAENLMIVDLLRNDLSRVCQPGSVRVSDLFRTETFPTVHHLVSVVHGRLAEGRSAADLLAACFPGGSVTGAPKLRAMEIIAELEPVWRGPYCGTVGYLGFDGSMDTSVTIRTFVLEGKSAYFHAGGAVVADSDPELEYRETLDKAEGLLNALTASE